MTLGDKIKKILINEVGEASKRPFRYKRDLQPYEEEQGGRYDHKKGEWVEKARTPRYLARKEKKNFQYLFKTKSGFIYEVSIENKLPRYDWYTQKELSNKEWEQEVSSMYNSDRRTYVNLRKMGASREDFANIWIVSFKVVDGPEDEVETIYYGTGELQSYTYRTIQDEENRGEFFKIMATVTKIIKDHLRKYDGKILHFQPIDDRRGRVFSRYILQQMPNAKMWEDNSEFYFYLK